MSMDETLWIAGLVATVIAAFAADVIFNVITTLTGLLIVVAYLICFGVYLWYKDSH